MTTITIRELIMTGKSRSKKVRDREVTVTYFLWGAAVLVGLPKIFGFLTVSEKVAAWAFASGLTTILLGVVLWSISRFLVDRHAGAVLPITNAESAAFYEVEESALDFMQDQKLMVLHLTGDTHFAKVEAPSASFQDADEWQPSAPPRPKAPGVARRPVPRFRRRAPEPVPAVLVLP